MAEGVPVEGRQSEWDRVMIEDQRIIDIRLARSRARILDLPVSRPPAPPAGEAPDRASALVWLGCIVALLAFWAGLGYLVGLWLG
jgi:hypothetical protein